MSVKHPLNMQNANENVNTKPTEADLWGHLADCLVFLRNSARLFDEGCLAEAKRLAVVVRVLVHETSNSHALLAQLNLQRKMKFVDTSAHGIDFELPKIAANALLIEPIFRLSLLRILINKDMAASYVPHLDQCLDRRRSLLRNFDDWWKGTVIQFDDVKWSRSEVVSLLANKFGGAHVAPKVNSRAYDFIQKGSFSLGLAVNSDDPPPPLASAELYTMRQIAHEVIRSLERKLQIGEDEVFTPPD